MTTVAIVASIVMLLIVTAIVVVDVPVIRTDPDPPPSPEVLDRAAFAVVLATLLRAYRTTTVDEATAKAVMLAIAAEAQMQELPPDALVDALAQLDELRPRRRIPWGCA